MLGAAVSCDPSSVLGIALAASDPELPVLRPLHPAVFADHHRRDGLAALDRRDVEALDAARNRRQAQDDAQRFERVVVGGDGLVEARLVGDLRVARGEIEQPALLAALRHDEPDAMLAADRSATPERPRSPTRSSAIGRWISGGAVALGVELLQRGLQDVRLRAWPPRRHRRRPSAVAAPRVASSIALDHLAAADLEHLHDGAGGPDLEAERVAIAERRCPSSSAGAAAASRSCASRRAAARPARSAPRPPPRSSAAAGASTSSSLRPSRNSRVCCDRRRVASPGRRSRARTARCSGGCRIRGTAARARR